MFKWIGDGIQLYKDITKGVESVWLNQTEKIPKRIGTGGDNHDNLAIC